MRSGRGAWAQAFPGDLRGARGVFGVIERTYFRKESPPCCGGGLEGGGG